MAPVAEFLLLLLFFPFLFFFTCDRELLEPEKQVHPFHAKAEFSPAQAQGFLAGNALAN